MNQFGEIVYLVDDDASIREAMSDLLETQDLTVISFDSAESFLQHDRADAAACLILDLQLPEMSGLDLQTRLAGTSNLPIIFISGHGDIPTSVRAMKGGAMEFLTKPVDQRVLTAAIRAAFKADRETRVRLAGLEEVRRRVARLTPRERQVLPLLVAGYLNKQVAARMGISEVTVQIHRGRIMRKMAAPSFADLVRLCGLIGIPESSQALTAHVSPDPAPGSS